MNHPKPDDIQSEPPERTPSEIQAHPAPPHPDPPPTLDYNIGKPSSSEELGAWVLTGRKPWKARMLSLVFVAIGLVVWPVSCLATNSSFSSLSSQIGSATGDDGPEQKADELQGAWRLGSFEAADLERKLPFDDLTITFLPGGKMVIREGDTKEEARYTLDPTTTPKHLDMTPISGPNKGRTIQTIYAIEGDTLTICGGSNSTVPRPTEFASKEGSYLVLGTLQRVKE
jgi:uncharacterized protein (TIGR03067 family)